MPTFEYTTAFYHLGDDTPVKVVLNDFGARGWELCAVIRHKPLFRTGFVSYYFKRQKL